MSKIKAIGFWALSLTWGGIMTAIGLVAAFFLIIIGNKPKIYHYFICFEVGYNWGGVNLGAVFIVCRNCSEATKRHEAGHGLQNIILGVFMPFIVAIPSFVRYWYRVYLERYNKEKFSQLEPYDAFWVEGWATELGWKYFR